MLMFATKYHLSTAMFLVYLFITYLLSYGYQSDDVDSL